jgi:Spy/CpxP family protein refolding chaperone
MKRKAIQWTVLAIALAATLVALGGCRHHGMTEASREAMFAMAMKRVDGVLDQVQATPEQKQAVFAAIDDVHAQVKAFHDSCQGTHAALLAQWKSDQPDMAAVNALVDTRLEEFEGLVHAAVDAAARLHGVFQSEQRNQIAAVIEAHMAQK